MTIWLNNACIICYSLFLMTSYNTCVHSVITWVYYLIWSKGNYIREEPQRKCWLHLPKTRITAWKTSIAWRCWHFSEGPKKFGRTVWTRNDLGFQCQTTFEYNFFQIHIVDSPSHVVTSHKFNILETFWKPKHNLQWQLVMVTTIPVPV